MSADVLEPEIIEKKPLGGPHGEPRSDKWPTARRHHLLLQPQCQWCGATDHLEVHHKMPFHLDPDKELDESNFITLCENGDGANCHLKIGHHGNWKSFNATVVADCTAQQKLWKCKKLGPVQAVSREEFVQGIVQSTIQKPRSGDFVTMSKPITPEAKMDAFIADYHTRGQKITDLTASLDAAKLQAAADVKKAQDDSATALQALAQNLQAKIDALTQRNTELLALSDSERASLNTITAKIDGENIPGLAPVQSTDDTAPLTPSPATNTSAPASPPATGTDTAGQTPVPPVTATN